MAENILHFGAIRLRLNGSGNLKMKLISLDDSRESTLKELPIENNGREKIRQCNFISQRARLKLSTIKINEQVTINRIIVYANSKAVAYPM